MRHTLRPGPPQAQLLQLPLLLLPFDLLLWWLLLLPAQPLVQHLLWRRWLCPPGCQPHKQGQAGAA